MQNILKVRSILPASIVFNNHINKNLEINNEGIKCYTENVGLKCILNFETARKYTFSLCDILDDPFLVAFYYHPDRLNDML